MSFSYNQDKKILELESRQGLYNIVTTFAGSHFRDIQRKANLSIGSTKYHLDYLCKRGLIKIEKDGRNLRYFPNNISIQNRSLLSLLRQSALRNIVLYILIYPNCKQEDIASYTSLTPSTISFHLNKLKEKKIIAIQQKGRKSHYIILVNKDDLVNVLITYKESFVDSLVNKVINMWDFE